VNRNAKGELREAHRFKRAGRRAEALDGYQSYLKVQPSDARTWADLGGLHLEMGHMQEAQEACSRALRIDQNLLAAQVNLVNALIGLGQFIAAANLSRQILDKQPRHQDARLALARCLCLLGEQVQARSHLEALIVQDPRNRQAYSLLLEVFAHLGLWQDYEEAMGRLIGIHEHPKAIDTYDRGLLDLRMGNMPRGWARYESRLECPGLIVPKRNFSEPRWDGRSFKGKTLLVHYEQGLGDTFMFVRYAPQIKARGGQVLLEVQPALADVVSTCPGVDEVVCHGSPAPAFDLHIPLLSLPWVFNTDLMTIPAEVPYLGVPGKVPNRQGIRNLISASEGSIRIGLAWAGSPKHKRDTERSLSPSLLAPLAALPGVSWFSFQLDSKEEPPLPGIVSLDPFIRNFSDTAYALTEMNLVITVDTALAHLAGAMGIPTLLLVAFFPDFRWMMGRNDTPWYPTVRLYRQPAPGNWSSVIRQVVDDLLSI
jgi:tetratricopeptide (TPR) repeat protein